VVCPADLCDMAKARLLEAQCPVAFESRRYHAWERPHRQHAPRRWGHRSLRSVGRWGMTPFKGMNGTPNSRYRLTSRKSGMAYGSRDLGQRSLRSSLRAGKPRTRRRETGAQMAQPRKVRVMRTAERGRAVLHDRWGAPESRMTRKCPVRCAP